MSLSCVDPNWRGLGYASMRIMAHILEHPVKPKKRPVFRVPPSGENSQLPSWVLDDPCTSAGFPEPAIFGTMACSALDIDTLIVPCVGAVLCGCLALALNKPLIAVSSSFFGASLIVDAMRVFAHGEADNPGWPIATLVLAVVGIAIQYGITGRKLLSGARCITEKIRLGGSR